MGQVHYELFVRRKPGSGWTLEQAGEDRLRMVETARELLATGHAAAVRVSKETLDPDTREFQSVTILNEGAPEIRKAAKVVENRDPLCITPQDLYSMHARERIGRLLEPWLTRNRATPFELMHRPDLVERLEASGVELQHAIQKVAIPEAQARGLTVHEVIRGFQALVERSVSRLLRDGRKGVFPDFAKEGFAAAVTRLLDEPERGYLLGGGIAQWLSGWNTWSDKVVRLLDLADAAPQEPRARAAALLAIEAPLAEIVGLKTGLAELLGGDLDLGSTLTALTRLAGDETVELVIRMEPAVARAMPPFSGAAQRLETWLSGSHFEAVRSSIAQRVLRELTGPRRLRPGDPLAEIETLRVLAMTLTASNGRLMAAEDIRDAFVSRSRMLVTSSFVEALLEDGQSGLQDAERLVRLAENVTGAANKRLAARWLSANIATLRFEKDLRYGAESPAQKLSGLAALQRSVQRIGLEDDLLAPIHDRLGEVGGLVEADCKVVSVISRADTSVITRLTLLLSIANGETAPLGPAAERARAEAMKLVRTAGFRDAVSRSPDIALKARDLMRNAGLAA